MIFCPEARFAALILIAFIAFHQSEAIAQESGGKNQSNEIFSESLTKSVKLNYLLSLPNGYDGDKEKKWPLVVFLHGAGERGDNLDLVKIHGPPKLVESGKSFPFILISPQCPKESSWTFEPVLELIDHAEAKFRVDPDRIYLTGLSMGGYGTWHFAAEEPDRFAAIVPICGGGIPYFMRRIPQLPVWVFHGAKDTAVPISESERLVEALKKAGNESVKFTVYPEAGHDSWTESYNLDTLYSWLLSHARKP